MSSRPVRVGLLGFGAVGSAVAAQLRSNQQAIQSAVGRQVVCEAAAVRTASKERDGLPEWVSTNPVEIARAPEIDLVVEVMGGLDPAGEAIRSALSLGKPVVTANKELLAREGAILAAGQESLRCEASVGGGMPIVRMIRESLLGTTITRIQGVLNGTTNYILSEMESTQAPFGSALASAQKLGYAEADPTNDVEGWDALFKGVVLAGLASGAWIDPDSCPREGITAIDQSRMQAAREKGCVIRLVVDVNLDGPTPAVKVGPVEVPADSWLGALKGPANGVLVSTREMNDLFLSGPGAGGAATATAVVADIIDLAKGLG